MEKKRMPTLSFLHQPEEVPFQAETPRMSPHPVSCKFGSCSLFDAKAENADSLPLEFPAGSFLEETLAGILGAPDRGVCSKSWTRLQAAVGKTDCAKQCCAHLAWAGGPWFGSRAFGRGKTW
eukprot:g30321.t1